MLHRDEAVEHLSRVFFHPLGWSAEGGRDRFLLYDVFEDHRCVVGALKQLEIVCAIGSVSWKWCRKGGSLGDGMMW